MLIFPYQSKEGSFSGRIVNCWHLNHSGKNLTKIVCLRKATLGFQLTAVQFGVKVFRVKLVAGVKSFLLISQPILHNKILNFVPIVLPAIYNSRNQKGAPQPIGPPNDGHGIA